MRNPCVNLCTNVSASSFGLMCMRTHIHMNTNMYVDMCIDLTRCAVGTCAQHASCSRCVDMRVDICKGICSDMCADRHVDLSVDMCVDMSEDLCVDTGVGMCVDTCAMQKRTVFNAYTPTCTRAHVYLRDAVCACDIPCPNRCAESKLAVVGQPDRIAPSHVSDFFFCQRVHAHGV